MAQFSVVKSSREVPGWHVRGGGGRVVRLIARAGAGGLGAISPKPSCWGSVLGGPLETAVEGDGRR